MDEQQGFEIICTLLLVVSASSLIFYHVGIWREVRKGREFLESTAELAEEGPRMSYGVVGARFVGGAEAQEAMEKATLDHAWENMIHLLKEADCGGCTFERDPEGKDDAGRFDFIVKHPKSAVWCSVSMPGIPLEKVRYVDRVTQNVWDFPRLYVDGNSWAWLYAVDNLRGAFFDEERKG